MSNLSNPSIIKSHISAALARLFTSLPGRVESYDPQTRTVSVTPLIKRIFGDGIAADNQTITDVPVVFQSAGGAEITLPVKKGDTVLIVFSMRNIQDWLISEGEENTPKFRRNHNLEDAIAIPGLFTKNTARAANPDNLEILFGDSKIQIKPDNKIVIDSGNIEIGEGATEKVVLGDTFKSYFDSHTHGPGSFATSQGPVAGASGSPITPMPSNSLSDKVRIL